MSDGLPVDPSRNATQAEPSSIGKSTSGCCGAPLAVSPETRHCADPSQSPRQATGRTTESPVACRAQGWRHMLEQSGFVDVRISPPEGLANFLPETRPPCRLDRAIGILEMRQPESVRSLENLGRIRLSPSFFMRDFLHSEIADFYGIPNIPEAPDLAIAAGSRLCVELLEPLQATFGRLAIRSAYRAPAV